METHTVHCPVCRSDVRICTTRGPMHRDGQASIADHPKEICLDFREACLGPEEDAPPSALRRRCALFNVSALVMGIDRVRSGLTPEPRPMVTAHCSGCGEETRQERVGRGFTVCEVCRSTNDAERRSPTEGRTT